MAAVIVEIPDHHLLTDWQRCEAFRLEPHTDGSYTLTVTTDLAETVRLECEAL